MIKSAILLSILAVSLQAGIVVSVPDVHTGGDGNRVFAASWTQAGTFNGVSITAGVFGVPNAGVTATAWLTTAIGPGATIADQIATAPITSSTIFSGLTLGPQTYYLVLLFNSGTNVAGWWENTFARSDNRRWSHHRQFLRGHVRRFSELWPV